MDADNITAAVAVYAAVVATGALALEVRRWFESGPRLVVSVMAPAVVIGGIGQDNNSYIFVGVTNRGSAATTITHFGIFRFLSFWKRFREQPEVAAIVPLPNVGAGGELPFLLRPGERWTGSAIFDDDLMSWALKDELFVAIHHSGSGRPKLRKVRLTDASKA